MIKGSEYKADVIKKIGKLSWGKRASKRLILAIKDLTLDKDDTIMMINKAIKQLNLIMLEDRPIIVHHLLSYKEPQYATLVLEGIINHFTLLDELMENNKKKLDLNQQTSQHSNFQIKYKGYSISEDKLRGIEGTCIYKINLAMKQDKTLANQFIKYVKSPSSSFSQKLSTFFICTLLSIASSENDSRSHIIDYFKDLVERNFRYKLNSCKSTWYLSFSLFISCLYSPFLFLLLLPLIGSPPSPSPVFLCF